MKTVKKLSLILSMVFILLTTPVSAFAFESKRACLQSNCSNCVFQETTGPNIGIWVCMDEGIKNPALSNKLGSGEGADAIAQLIASALKIVYSVAGLILLAMLLSGGIGFMTAGGDKSKVEAAQGRISSAIIGFVIFMSVFVIINFIAPALGLTFLQILTIEWPTIL